MQNHIYISILCNYSDQPKMKLLLGLVVTLVASSSAKVFFEEQFKDDSWSDRWVQSEHKDDLGKFELSAGGFYGDAEKDKGIKTSQDAKFYGLSAKFDKVLNFEHRVG